MNKGLEEMEVLVVKAGLVDVKATARVARRNRAIKNLEREAKVIILLLYLFFRINPSFFFCQIESKRLYSEEVKSSD
jgi:hypothetical protein